MLRLLTSADTTSRSSSETGLWLWPLPRSAAWEEGAEGGGGTVQDPHLVTGGLFAGGLLQPACFKRRKYFLSFVEHLFGKAPVLIFPKLTT